MAVESSLGAARYAVAAVFLLDGVVVASWVPHVPVLKTIHGLTDGQLGILLLATAAGAVTSLSAAGGLTSRFGSRRTIRVAATALCLALPLPVLSPSVAGAATALFLFGAGNGALDVAMNAQAVALESRWGSAILSSLHGCFSLGGMLGALLAGFAIHAGASPGTHLAGTSLLALGAVHAVARWLLRDTEPPISGPMFVMPSRTLVALGAMGFVALMAEGAMADWSAVWLQQVLHAAPAVSAAGFAAFSLAMAAGRFSGDRLVARLEPERVLRVSALLAAGSLLGGLLGGRTDAAIVACALVGVGVANQFPILLSLAARSADGHADPPRALAAVTSLSYLGFLAGPPVIGTFADVAGLPAGLGVVAASCAAVALGTRGWDGHGRGRGRALAGHFGRAPATPPGDGTPAVCRHLGGQEDRR